MSELTAGVVRPMQEEEESEEYKNFVEKFKPKKTTDDCYTPDNIYDAICGWVEKEYNVNRDNFVRPFYPGGDYENYKYRGNITVVDNPPFSLLSKIIRFYCEKEIKFFLFAPTLTLFTATDCKVTYISTHAQIVYENGAKVNTSFVTNLDSCRVRTAPDLLSLIEEENRMNTKVQTIPKYEYPEHVITAARMALFSKYGINLRIDDENCKYINSLDEQKKMKKSIFGGGYLLSDRAAADRAAADRAAADRAGTLFWKLSDRELEIVRRIGREKTAV